MGNVALLHRFHFGENFYKEYWYFVSDFINWSYRPLLIFLNFSLQEGLFFLTKAMTIWKAKISCIGLILHKK